MAIIGIDLGTTNSLACVCLRGETLLIPNPLGDVLTPSVVSLNEEGEICMGAVAKERLVSHPEVSVSSFKRHMGTNKMFQLGDRRFRPQELAAFVLRQLKEDAERFLNEEVTEAVVSVPAYFNDNQRYATKEAGQLAGLKVERLVNEPSAAALAASRISGEEEQCYLVFDFGGGTLDVSVVDYFDNVIEIISVSGDNKLGGDDFDHIIARRFCGENQLDYEELEPRLKATLLRLSESLKRELTTKDPAVLTFDAQGRNLSMELSNLELAQSARELFARIDLVVKRALKDRILPTSKRGYYTNACDKQTCITIAIYQGDAYYCKDNLKLGEIRMDVLPVKKGENQIEVCFTYDINGILEVEVTDFLKKQKRQETFTSESSRMSPEELERRLEELQAYKMLPPGGIRTRLALARGERLFAELCGEQRKVVAQVMEGLQEAIYLGRSDQQMLKMCREAQEIYDRLERIRG